jgi:hypothetical protein
MEPDKACVVEATDGAKPPPELRATEATSLRLGSAHAASSGATEPPATMRAPSLRMSRRLRIRVHGLSRV